MATTTASEKHSFASIQRFPFFPPVAPTSKHYNRAFYYRVFHRLSLLSLSTKLILTMVAIPTALLASTLIPNLSNLGPLNAAARHYENTVTNIEAPPVVTRQAPSSNDFASVLGPVVNLNFPDPSIIHIAGISYAFATNNRGHGSHGMIHIQMATSSDNQTWTYLDGQDALPIVGSWATGARTWAPDVIQVVRSGVPAHGTGH